VAGIIIKGMISVMKYFTRLILAAFLICVLFAPSDAAEDRIRVGIMAFDSKTPSVSQQQAAIISDVLTGQLASSKTIAVYERQQLEQIAAEQRLGMSGLVDINTAVEIGKIIGLQYVLLGSVTELEQGAGGFAVGFIGSATHEAKATIDARVINVTTGEIEVAISASGESKSEGTVFSYGGITGAQATFGDIEARAISDAVIKLAHRIRDSLGGESSHILTVEQSKCTINIGSTMGAKVGTTYLVYAEGRMIMDMDGTPLGRDKLPLAALKVTNVSGNFSECVVAAPSKSSVLARGDKIEPISAKELKNIKYPAKRPAEASRLSSDTMAALFGDGGGTPAPTKEAPTSASETPEVSSPASVSEPASDVLTPEPAVAATPSPARNLDFDPNQSTEEKVITAYAISEHDKNTLGIQQRGAFSLYRNKNYKGALRRFAELTEAYPSVNYLAAYWAGMSALKLKDKEGAAEWFDRAIKINRKYKPAIDEKAKL